MNLVLNIIGPEVAYSRRLSSSILLAAKENSIKIQAHLAHESIINMIRFRSIGS